MLFHRTGKRRFMSFIVLVLLGWLLAPAGVHAQLSFSKIVVFGTSLSDSGNVYALTGQQSMPPYDTLDSFRIPDYPYADGGHHFSNGATWIEQFARTYALAADTRPAFGSSKGPAFNYAVGGARARDTESGRVNLPAQVNAFLRNVNGAAPQDALYVLEFGANDLRDALVAAATGNDPGAVITGALSSIGSNMGVLYAAGARKFLVCNAPDMGKTPAVLGLNSVSPGAAYAAGALTRAFNAGLEMVLNQIAALPGVEIARVDLYGLLNRITADPAAFGLTVADAACVTPDAAPFECQQPDEYLFWDGIHPTTTAQGILAQEAASAVGSK